MARGNCDECLCGDCWNRLACSYSCMDGCGNEEVEDCTLTECNGYEVDINDDWCCNRII